MIENKDMERMQKLKNKEITLSQSFYREDGKECVMLFEEQVDRLKAFGKAMLGVEVCVRFDRTEPPVLMLEQVTKKTGEWPIEINIPLKQLHKLDEVNP